MTEKNEILKNVKNQLQLVFKNRISQVILFGSQAKNKEKKDSDYDILIITADTFTWQERDVIRDICYEISLDNDILIDSKIISQIEIESSIWGKHPLITDALNYGIIAG